jgi:predicted Zn-dependent protease with MMP-like domain
MLREEFEKLIDEEFPKAVPEKFHHLLKNVAFLVEDEAPHADLLGQYHGIPHTARGDYYGVGGTLPDTITLYQKTIEEHARHTAAPVEQVVRETIWHEVAHYLGYDEDQVRGREDERDNL